ncbi:MAG TPA: Gfo/Idh/MocA family oxidoreductase, partial [Vicinamibacteria bacterium]
MKKLGRRDFLMRSALGAAALPGVAKAPTVFAAPTDAPGSRIGLGIIGTGARAHSGLLPAAQQVKGVEIVGVCDAYRGRVIRAQQRTGGRAKEYKDWKALLADPAIDAVVIGTPDHWHKDQAIAALAAGKDVYLEKPMTLRIEDGAPMIAAAQKHGRILQVGSQGISSKTQETAREWIRSGRLGKVTLVRAAYNRNTQSGAWLYPIPPDASPLTVDWDAFLGPAPRRPYSLERFFRWRCYWDYSGGLATDLFVHLLTTIHFLLDAKMPSRVVASGQNYRFKQTHEVPDTLNAILEYPEGFTVVLGCTFNNESGGGFEVLGTEASLVLRDDKVELRPEHPVEGNGWIVESWPEALERAYYEDPKIVAAERPERWEPRLEGRGETFTEVGEDATLVHLRRFFESVRTRKAPVEDGERGHRAAAAAHLVNESVRKGARPMEWDAAAG